MMRRAQNGVLRRFVRDLYSGKTMSVVAYGDSVTQGANVTGFLEAGKLGALLTGINPNLSYFNEGSGGTTSQWGVDNIGLVTAHSPSYCILNFGINDWGYNPTTNAVALATYSSNMGSIIDQLRAASCEPIVWVSGPVSSSEESYGYASPSDDSSAPAHFSAYANTLRDLALTKKVPCLNIRDYFVRSWKSGLNISGYFNDSLHLNQVGNDIMYRLFSQWLLGGCRNKANLSSS